MRCLYCGKELALFKRLTGGGEFCSDAHKQSYQEEYNRLALSRLLQAQTKTEESKTRKEAAAKGKARQAEAAPAPKPELNATATGDFVPQKPGVRVPSEDGRVSAALALELAAGVQLPQTGQMQLLDTPAEEPPLAGRIPSSPGHIAPGARDSERPKATPEFLEGMGPVRSLETRATIGKVRLPLRPPNAAEFRLELTRFRLARFDLMVTGIHYPQADEAVDSGSATGDAMADQPELVAQ